MCNNDFFNMLPIKILPFDKSVFYKIKIESLDDENYCYTCNMQLKRKDYITCVCNGCGMQKTSELDNGEFSYDVMNGYSSNTTMRIASVTQVGKYMNHTLMGLGCDNKQQRIKRITDKVINKVYQSKDDSIPIYIVNSVVEDYIKIQEENNLVRRGDRLSGLLAALLYNKCVIERIPRKPKTITNIFNISDTVLSEGAKELHALASHSAAIILPEHGGEIENFVNQYFEKLSLNAYDEYKGFVVELINETTNDKIVVSSNASRNTTRCAGAICILCSQLKLKHITRDIIANVCLISKSTFSRYISLVNAHKAKPEIDSIFDKYNVPKL